MPQFYKDGKVANTDWAVGSSQYQSYINEGWGTTPPQQNQNIQAPAVVNPQATPAPQATQPIAQDPLSSQNLAQYIKNPNYNPNDPSVNRYIPSGQNIVTPPATTTLATTARQPSLLDIYNARPDVQAEAKRLFPGQNATVQGTEANRWLNDWYNRIGKAEGADMASNGIFGGTTPTASTTPSATQPTTQPPQTTTPPPTAPPAAPPATTGATPSVSGTPEGMNAVFGPNWQPADIFKQKGLVDKGILGAVRIAGSPDVFTIGPGGGWIKDQQQFQDLFGTTNQAGIVGEISQEQAKLLGINPEGIVELKAAIAKQANIGEIFKLAQEAGMSLEDTMNLISSQYPVDTAGIRKDLGIEDVVTKLFQQPSKTQQEVYDQAYTDSGLAETKAKIADIDEKINKARADQATATNQVNENPWISESSRVGKMGKLNTQVENTINNLTNQRTQLLDMYDKGLDKIERFMLRYNEQNRQEKALLAEQFNYLLGEAERQATEAQQKATSENMRYIPEYLKEMAKQIRSEEGIDTEIIKLKDGTQILINSKTGEQISTYGGDGYNNVAEGIVGGYNISRYATDPNHEASVNSILLKIGKFNNWEEMDTYIKQVAPGSPITGEMIGKASEEFGVDWEMMVAMMQQDSSLGTKGKGARTFNPGNVGNDDTGREVNYGNWQAGVNAVGNWLSKHRAKTITLTPSQISAGNKLAKDIYGSGAIKTKEGYANFVKPLLERMKAGESIDSIADDLRLQGQSTEFTGAIRDAAQQITSRLSTTQTEAVFDKLDDALASGETGKVLDFLKKMAIENSAGGAEQAKMIMGQERTVEFLDEIYADLQAYEAIGGNTNIFTGTLEEIAKKAGTVVNPELRRIAVKITKARQQYRRSMTGVAFSPGENLEYDAVFPSIAKTMNFNTATLSGLKEAFKGDVEFFYSFAMGQEAYNKLFKGRDDGMSDEDAYQEYLNIINQ